MAIVRFEQDPDSPVDGMGLFHGDDGSAIYAHDPEMAASLTQPAPDLEAVAYPLKDDRTAQNEYASYQPEPVSNASTYQPAPPPSRADVEPQMSSVQPEAPPAQAAPPPQAQQEQADADKLQRNIDEYAMRPVVSGPTRGGVIPVKQDVTREASGIPYDPNGPQAMARADAHLDVQLANQQAYRSQAARAAGEAAAYEAALPELQRKAAIAQKQVEHRQRIYRQERAELDDLVAESANAQKSFNANRWFDDRGAVGAIGAGIAQAFGAYSAALVGGDNQIAKQINSYIDRDIANQRAQIESGKAGVDNQLMRLKMKYGDLDQAEAALRIATQKIVDNQIASYAASTKNADLIAAGDKWLAENQQRYILAEQAFENASYGKTSVKTDAKVVAPSAGGQRAPTEKEIQERYNTLEKRGKVVEGTYEGEIKRQKALGMDPEKADKQKPLVIENLDGSQVEARSAPEATKIRELRSLQVSADKTARELEKLSSVGARLSPTQQKKYLANLEATINSANTLFGQGVVRGEDVDRYKSQILGDQYGIGAAEAAKELREIINNAYQARVDSQRGSEVVETHGRRGAQVNYTGKASKNPTAKGQFEEY